MARLTARELLCSYGDAAQEHLAGIAGEAVGSVMRRMCRPDGALVRLQRRRWWLLAVSPIDPMAREPRPTPAPASVCHRTW